MGMNSFPGKNREVGMQSPLALTVRALVMLVCLVAAPLFAIFGRSTPQVVENFLDQAASALKDEASGPAPAASVSLAAAEEAPLFRPLASAATGSGNTLAPPGPFLLASHSAAVNDAPTVTQTGSIANAPVGQTSGSAAMPRTGIERAGAPPSGDAASPFAGLETALRALGASQYVLETWGERGESYRFSCRLKSLDRSQPDRVFETVDGDAIEAMSKVLRQIQAYRDASTL